LSTSVGRMAQAEQGKRAFTAVELGALAAVLQVPVAWLITPPVDLAKIEMPNRQRMPASAVAGVDAADEGVHAVQAKIAALRRSTYAARSAVVSADAAARELGDLLAPIFRADAEETGTPVRLRGGGTSPGRLRLNPASPGKRGIANGKSNDQEDPGR
jgi:hypothetical protein